MDCGCAPIFGFSLRRQLALQQSDKFRTPFLVNFFTNLNKNSVAKYASIWTVFSPSIRRPEVFCNAVDILQFRRYKIRKFAAETSQKAKFRQQRCAKYIV